MASLLAVPLRVGLRLVAVLAVASVQHDAFSDSDADLLLTMGAQAASALSNARLYAESQRERRQTEALADIAKKWGRFRPEGEEVAQQLGGGGVRVGEVLLGDDEEVDGGLGVDVGEDDAPLGFEGELMMTSFVFGVTALSPPYSEIKRVWRRSESMPTIMNSPPVLTPWLSIW